MDARIASKGFKAGFSLALCFLFALSSLFAPAMAYAAEGPLTGESEMFADAEGHWASRYISAALQKRIIGGYEDGTFRPDNPITRAEMAVVFTGFGIPDIRVAADFPDATPGRWYSGYVNGVYAMGVMSGDGHNFNPDATTTREEAIVTASRILGLFDGGGAVDLDEYGDSADISFWAEAHFRNLIAGGVLAGYPEGDLRPKNEISRAEFIKLISAAFDLAPEKIKGNILQVYGIVKPEAAGMKEAKDGSIEATVKFAMFEGVEYQISRDGGASWQGVTPAESGQFKVRGTIGEVIKARNSNPAFGILTAAVAAETELTVKLTVKNAAPVKPAGEGVKATPAPTSAKTPLPVVPGGGGGGGGGNPGGGGGVTTATPTPTATPPAPTETPPTPTPTPTEAPPTPTPTPTEAPPIPTDAPPAPSASELSVAFAKGERYHFQTTIATVNGTEATTENIVKYEYQIGSAPEYGGTWTQLTDDFVTGKELFVTDAAHKMFIRLIAAGGAAAGIASESAAIGKENVENGFPPSFAEIIDMVDYENETITIPYEYDYGGPDIFRPGGDGPKPFYFLSVYIRYRETFSPSPELPSSYVIRYDAIQRAYTPSISVIAVIPGATPGTAMIRLAPTMEYKIVKPGMGADAAGDDIVINWAKGNMDGTNVSVNAGDEVYIRVAAVPMSYSYYLDYMSDPNRKNNYIGIVGGTKKSLPSASYIIKASDIST